MKKGNYVGFVEYKKNWLPTYKLDSNVKGKYVNKKD